jgi:hypothetical protein
VIDCRVELNVFPVLAQRGGDLDRAETSLNEAPRRRRRQSPYLEILYRSNLARVRRSRTVADAPHCSHALELIRGAATVTSSRAACWLLHGCSSPSTI